LALHCLGLAGYRSYVPRIAGPRKTSVALFPTYVFISIDLQWHTARWAPGVWKLIMAGEQPARVPDRVLDELRSRERDGLVELPPPPRLQPLGPKFKSGDQVRISGGPFSGLVGLVDGLRPRQRVEILLATLGRVEMATSAVERLA
jgi:transcriptional antiterminator RfaH